jgi:hypothetical protein
MADYSTMGRDDDELAGADDNDYMTVGQARSLMLARPGMMTLARPNAPIARPVSPRLNPAMLQPFRPGAQAPMTQAQVVSIVRSELERRVPYGDVPTRPHADEAMFPMGLGFATLTSGNAGVGVLTAQPQRAFRGERLVLSIFRSAGAAGIPVVIANFQIGDYKQLVGGSSLPVEVFAGDAFGVRLMLDASIPGVLYALNINTLANVPAGESIIVSGAVIGRAGEAAAR